MSDDAVLVLGVGGLLLFAAADAVFWLRSARRIGSWGERAAMALWFVGLSLVALAAAGSMTSGGR